MTQTRDSGRSDLSLLDTERGPERRGDGIGRGELGGEGETNGSP